MPLNRQPPGRVIPWERSAPALNMAVDQALLESVDITQQPTLRLYGWSQPSLSLGYFQRRGDRAQHVTSGELAMVRRATGGGAIVHHHELTYSIAVPVASHSLGANRALYGQVHQAMIAALADFSVPATTFADSGIPPRDGTPFLCFMRRSGDDLITHGYKVLGSAQRKSRRAILQHGSLLLCASPHAPELPGINDLTGRSLTADQLADAFSDQIQRTLAIELTPRRLTEPERARSADIAESRFASANWTGRR